MSGEQRIAQLISPKRHRLNLSRNLSQLLAGIKLDRDDWTIGLAEREREDALILGNARQQWLSARPEMRTQTSSGSSVWLPSPQSHLSHQFRQSRRAH